MLQNFSYSFEKFLTTFKKSSRFIPNKVVKSIQRIFIVRRYPVKKPISPNIALVDKIAT